MFEEKTFEKILGEALEYGRRRGVDTRQGSIFYDAVAGTCASIAMFYIDLKSSIDLTFLSTTVGEYLDEKGAEFKVYRNPATSARYVFEYEGTKPELGERFFAGGFYFTLFQSDGLLLLEADGTGSAQNSIPPGTAAVPVNNLSGLISASFGDLYDPGVDVENDEDYRQRIREKIAGPAENGNRQHYKTWCEEVPGVGRARIEPLFAGENTVLGILIGSDGHPAAKAVVERVQEYIDPIAQGLQADYKGGKIPIGDGVGGGVANIGAHFAAVAADSLPIAVSFFATLSDTATKQQAAEEASQAICEHLKALALSAPESEEIVVRVSTIGALLYGLPSIIDYTNLTLNGQASNITVLDTQVAVLSEVTVDV